MIFLIGKILYAGSPIKEKIIKKATIANITFFTTLNIEKFLSPILLYAGSPIVALNSYLNEYIGPNDIFGEETLAGLRGTYEKNKSAYAGSI